MARQSPVKALGEVALRVNDLEKMKGFYQDVLGLGVLGEFPTAVLLKVAEDYGGHTQVLGLFDRSVPNTRPLTISRSRLHLTITNRKRSV